MSLINVSTAARRRGIKLKGSWRTSRLTKKRLKDMERVRLMVYANARERQALDYGMTPLQYNMRRDDWTLSNGLRNNDEAVFHGGTEPIRCMIVKVRGWSAPGKKGNVLIDMDGKRLWVLGSRLTPITSDWN